MVGVGGALGSIVRFSVGTYIGSRLGARFPYGTLFINITGSFLIGVILTVLGAKAEGAHIGDTWFR
jgi:CrcB protein